VVSVHRLLHAHDHSKIDRCFLLLLVLFFLSLSDFEPGQMLVDFDRDGFWDNVKQRGPVIHAPIAIKNIIVSKYSVQWLNISEPVKDFYSKNHMVAALTFAQPWTEDGITFYNSARLSMELSVEMKSGDVIGQEVRTYVILLFEYGYPS
jgi:hypothetical protein